MDVGGSSDGMPRPNIPISATWAPVGWRPSDVWFSCVISSLPARIPCRSHSGVGGERIEQQTNPQLRNWFGSSSAESMQLVVLFCLCPPPSIASTKFSTSTFVSSTPLLYHHYSHCYLCKSVSNSICCQFQPSRGPLPPGTGTYYVITPSSPNFCPAGSMHPVIQWWWSW